MDGRSFETSGWDAEPRRLRDDVPFPPAPAHHRAIVGHRERMASWPKLVADRTEHGTEARGVPQALEPLQPSLTLADRLVRVLDTVVLVPAAEMGDGRHQDGLRRRVARQPIGHDGTMRSPFRSFRKKRFAARALRRRCTRMSSTSPASSTARHSQLRSPLIIKQSSSRCQMLEHAPRLRLNRRAYSLPNRNVQRRRLRERPQSLGGAFSSQATHEHFSGLLTPESGR